MSQPNSLGKQAKWGRQGGSVEMAETVNVTPDCQTPNGVWLFPILPAWQPCDLKLFKVIIT